MRWIASVTILILGLVLISPARPVAQSPTVVLPDSGRLTIAARSAPEISVASTRLSEMTQRRELVMAEVHNDAVISGRRHETLTQVYQGIPVYGSSVTRQMSGDTTVSIFGSVQAGLTLDPSPALSLEEVTTILKQASGHELVAGTLPTLVIYPTLFSRYVLAYRATMTNMTTYFVDAQSGVVIRSEREADDQTAVGTGNGVLGDLKKMSTSQSGGTYKTQDRLRPAFINTLDTKGSDAALDRILSGGLALDSDLPTSATNTWTDAAVVDAHVHIGWVYDYFYRRHQWNSLDGLNQPINGIVHRGLINNAFFMRPPFGPGGAGAMAFGVTSAGVPITALDISGHELMHGVTYSALKRRTGDGLRDVFFTSLGPLSITLNGTVFPCSVSTLGGLPFYCESGRYVLAVNDPGATNEAFSDVFGTSVEFFFQPPGSGPFKADYLIAEDVSGFGPIRSLSAPGTKVVATTTTPVPYPDHFSRRLQSAIVIVQGTRANPVSLDVSTLTVSNAAPFQTATADSGGVHWNSTILSHAFYLAVEGGKNPTSGLSVVGVGSANREQVERAFFRAMKDLMPNSPTLPTAALAVYQSAVDLFGINSPAARAIGEAMVAVGLLTGA